MRDGRVFRGNAVQIVKAMQDIAYGELVNMRSAAGRTRDGAI